MMEKNKSRETHFTSKWQQLFCTLLLDGFLQKGIAQKVQLYYYRDDLVFLTSAKQACL